MHHDGRVKRRPKPTQRGVKKRHTKDEDAGQCQETFTYPKAYGEDSRIRWRSHQPYGGARERGNRPPDQRGDDALEDGSYRNSFRQKTDPEADRQADQDRDGPGHASSSARHCRLASGYQFECSMDRKPSSSERPQDWLCIRGRSGRRVPKLVPSSGFGGVELSSSNC